MWRRIREATSLVQNNWVFHTQVTWKIKESSQLNNVAIEQIKKRIINNRNTTLHYSNSDENESGETSPFSHLLEGFVSGEIWVSCFQVDRRFIQLYITFLHFLPQLRMSIFSRIIGPPEDRKMQDKSFRLHTFPTWPAKLLCNPHATCLGFLLCHYYYPTFVPYYLFYFLSLGIFNLKSRNLDNSKDRKDFWMIEKVGVFW